MKNFKTHGLVVLFLLVLTLVYFSAYLNPKEFVWGDPVAAYIPRAEMLQESIKEYGDFYPLWTPYYFAGSPYMLKPMLGMDYLTGIFIWLLPSYAAIKVSLILPFFLSGIAMYALAFYLLKRWQYAIIPALVYMFNGWIVSRFQMGHITTLNAYPFVPLIILFGLKALKNNWLRNSVITGILFALQYRSSPGLKGTLWTFPIFGLLLLFHLIGKKFPSRLKKAVFIGVVVFLVFFGLSAGRLLPSKEFIDMTSRGVTPYDEAVSRAVRSGQFFTKLVEPVYSGMPKVRREGYSYHIGIVALLLGAFAVYRKPKSKLNWYFLSVIAISLLLVSGSFIFYLFWKYIPGYGTFRYLPRILIIYVFAGAVLAGFGTKCLCERFPKKRNAICATLAVLVILNLAVFGHSQYRQTPLRNLEEVREQNHITNWLGEQPGIFRIHTWETKGIDWGTEFFTVPKKLENIYGYDTVWLYDYFQTYLGVGMNHPAKFWGMLNVKYVTATTELNVTGLKLVKKFDACEVCFPEMPKFQKAWGPYLYENEEFLPRAYLTNKAILVIGAGEQMKINHYGALTRDGLDMRKAVTIWGKPHINRYSLSELKLYDVIVPTTGSVNEIDLGKLRTYAGEGGILIPDILKGEEVVSHTEVSQILGQISGNYTPIPDENVITHSFDKKEIIIDKPQKGFLVLSEKYSLVPGWTAELNGEKKEVLRANGVLTAVYLDNEKGSLIFEYRPKWCATGLTITLITILLITGFFAIRRWKKQKGATT